MKEKPSEAAIQAWVRLTRAQQQAMETIESSLKAAKLPPLVWYDVLLEVEKAGAEGLRPFELEGAMLLAQYQLSRLLGRIEGEGPRTTAMSWLPMTAMAPWSTMRRTTSTTQPGSAP